MNFSNDLVGTVYHDWFKSIFWEEPHAKPQIFTLEDIVLLSYREMTKALGLKQHPLSFTKLMGRVRETQGKEQIYPGVSVAQTLCKNSATIPTSWVKMSNMGERTNTSSEIIVGCGIVFLGTIVESVGRTQLAAIIYPTKAQQWCLDWFDIGPRWYVCVDDWYAIFKSQ